MEALRASWEVPSIVHYCSLFREAFDLPDVEFEEFEDALLAESNEDDDVSPIILELLIQLLQGCYNREDIVTYNYEHYLSDIINYRWELEEQGTSPFANRKFSELSPRRKAHVIRKLCDYRLDVDDIEAELRGYEAENMRVEPLGFDANGASYWYFFGVRLYKEDPPPPEPAPPVEEKVATVQKRSRRRKGRGRRKGKRKVATKIVPKKVEEDHDRRRSSRIRDKQVIEVEDEEDVNDDEDTDVEEPEEDDIKDEKRDVKSEERDVKSEERDVKSEERDVKSEERDVKSEERDVKSEESDVKSKERDVKSEGKDINVAEKASLVENAIELEENSAIGDDEGIVEDVDVEKEITDLNNCEEPERNAKKTEEMKQEDTSNENSEAGSVKPTENGSKHSDDDETEVKKEPKSDVKSEDKKEPPKPDVKPEVKPKVMEPEPDYGPVRWHLMCSTMEDWQGFADGFTLSAAKCERDLSKTIIENFIPEIPRILEEQERRMRKRLAENAPRRISNRLERKRKEQMERESIMDQIHAEEDEMRLRDDTARRVVEEAEEEETRKQREDEKSRLREERSKRAELREMRAQMIAEGKEIPPELLYNENSSSSKTSNQNVWMDDDMKSLLLAIVDACMSHKEAWPFLDRVDEEYAPGYYDIVKRPMYLTKIEKRVKQRRYACRKEFLADFKLMFTNCYRFNGHDHDISKMAKSLERFFNVTHRRFLPKEDDMFQVDESDSNYYGAVPRQTGRVFRKYLPRREAGSKALEILHEAARNGHGDSELSLRKEEDDDDVQEVKVKMPKTEIMLRCLNRHPPPPTMMNAQTIRPNILSRPRIISPTNQMRIIGQNPKVRPPPARVTIMSPGGTPKTIPISGPNSPSWLQNLLANSKIDPSKAKIYIANSPVVRPGAATATPMTVQRFSSQAMTTNVQNAIRQPGIRTMVQKTPTGPVKIVHLVYKSTASGTGMTGAPMFTTATAGSDSIRLNGALVSPNTSKQLLVPSSATSAQIPIMQVVSNSSTTQQIIRTNAPMTTVVGSQPQAQQTISHNLLNAVVNQQSPLKSTTILTAPAQAQQQVSANILHTPTKSVQIIGNTLRLPRPQQPSTASQLLNRMKSYNPETNLLHNTVTPSESVVLASNVSKPAAPAQAQFVNTTLPAPAQVQFVSAMPAAPAQAQFVRATPTVPAQMQFVRATPPAPAQAQLVRATSTVPAQAQFVRAITPAPVQAHFVSATPTVPIQQNSVIINPINSGSQLQFQNINNNRAIISGNSQALHLQTSPVKGVNVNILSNLSNSNNQQHIISNQSNSGIQFQNVSQSGQNTILISSQSAGNVLQPQSSSSNIINIGQPQVNQTPRTVIQPVQTCQIVTSYVQTVSNSANQYGIQVRNGTQLQPGTVVIQPTVPSSPIVKSQLYNVTYSNPISAISSSNPGTIVTTVNPARTSIPGTILTTVNPSPTSTQHRITIPTTSLATVKRKLSSGENEHVTSVNTLQISPNKIRMLDNSPERNIFLDSNVILNDQSPKFVPVQVDVSNTRTVSIPQTIQNSLHSPNITQNRNVIQLIQNSGLGGKLLVNNSPNKLIQVPGSILTSTSSPSFVLKPTNSVQLTGTNVRPALNVVNTTTNLGNPQAIGLNPAKKVLFIPNMQGLGAGSGQALSGVAPIVQTSASNLQQPNMATGLYDNQATVMIQSPDFQYNPFSDLAEEEGAPCECPECFASFFAKSGYTYQFETVPASQSPSAISLGQSFVQTAPTGQQAENFIYTAP